MSTMNIGRPAATEYGSYFERYISLVEGENIVSTLGQQLSDTLSLLHNVSEEQAESRYASGKWSLKEVVGHVLDFERIFGYRALMIARVEGTVLPGCDQDELMRGADFNSYRLSDLAKEFEQVRRANISFFSHLGEEAWRRVGVASELDVSVRALAYIMAGHEAHHVQVIRSKYL
ncbi:MAG TPA: DinB family protein [Pyrinomonadaceae bacterium]|nr:DinB family protein [Pyrinomonadaceae bacterium]